MPSAVRPTNVARVSMLMRTDLLMNSIRTNSVDLLKVQNQLATGLKLSRPSDSPAEATTIMHLDNLIERSGQYLDNINYACDFLATTDTALGQAVDLTQQAHSLALESVGMGTDDAGRSANAQMIDQIIQQLITVANTTCRGSYIFAGQNCTQAPFEAANDAVRFTGDLAELQTRVAADNVVDFSVDGNQTFGAVSSEVLGIVDLDPDITVDTLLSDLNGAQGEGVRRGSVVINDGTSTTTVDLSKCVTVGDVINKINADAPASITAAIGADGTSLTLNSPGGNITVIEVGTGNTARDLGIFNSTGAGVTLVGQDVDARLTLATPVTALTGGAGIDTISGLTITNSRIANVGTIDLSGASTVEDVLNAMNNAGVSVRAEINADATGVNVFNLLSGSEMTIAENSGTTATDLGIRSLVGSTKLSALNGGSGMHTEPGQYDIFITDRAGNSCSVDLDTAVTVQDVIDLINAAAVAAGPPVQVTAGLAATGNGIELTDSSGGAGNLSVTTHVDNHSGYFTAAELGLDQSVAANTLTGSDVNPVKPDGVFSHLMALRDALNSNDDAAIFEAAAAMEVDRELLSNMRGTAGSQMRALEDRQLRMEENILATETLRSDIRDVDFTEAITRYQNLYTALQANLMTGSQLTNMSLLDFLQ